MLLRRITQHVREQNWTAIGIDFVIVVVGVFIGIQVSNWNEGRESRVSERAFVEAIRDDIVQNISDGQGFYDMLSGVREHGRRSLQSIYDDSSCAQQCWARLVDFFVASQWIDVRVNLAMYDEIKRSGLPHDAALKKTLTRYFGTIEQLPIIASELPRYRELSRSIIPAEVQQAMWQECIEISGRQQVMISDCQAAVSDAEASAIIDALRADDEIKSSLTFWMSTVSIVMVGLEDQSKEGQQVIEEIERYLAVRN